MSTFPWLLPVLGLVAFLYASVGHAGASGYVAVLALAGLTPVEIRPLALVLNLVVAAQGCWQFQRAGHLPWLLFRPLVLAGLPAAFLGGWLALPDPWFHRLLALVLIGSAVRLLQERRDPPQLRIPSGPQLLVSGLGLGLLAGLSAAPVAVCSSRRCCCLRGGPPAAKRRRCRRCSSWATLSVVWLAWCWPSAVPYRHFRPGCPG